LKHPLASILVLVAILAVSTSHSAAQFVLVRKTGSPYFLETERHHLQTLSDGNHIDELKDLTLDYRDSQGRTRTELYKRSVIDDDRRLALDHFWIDLPDGSLLSLNPHFQTVENVGLEAVSFLMASPQYLDTDDEDDSNSAKTNPKAVVESESIGNDVILGVEVSGTRTTTTYPPGAAGNEWAFRVVEETWWSQELGTVMRSRTVDPRIGEHVVRTTKFARGEPDPALFDIPKDYTPVESK
jgi:hypothetical protein